MRLLFHAANRTALVSGSTSSCHFIDNERQVCQAPQEHSSARQLQKLFGAQPTGAEQSTTANHRDSEAPRGSLERPAEAKAKGFVSHPSELLVLFLLPVVDRASQAHLTTSNVRKSCKHRTCLVMHIL